MEQISVKKTMTLLFDKVALPSAINVIMDNSLFFLCVAGRGIAYIC